LGRPGDVLVAFSTSGTSPNVVRATASARAAGMEVVAVTGHAGRPVADHATVTIVTPGGRWADRVQELHALVIHSLIEIVEHSLGSHQAR
jgi:D-sedoheptulose 7-phosphate isomerase